MVGCTSFSDPAGKYLEPCEFEEVDLSMPCFVLFARGLFTFLAVILLSASSSAQKASPQTPAPQKQVVFVPPPRTITDITAILDQQTPDRTLVAKRRAEADASPPKGADRKTLALFYFKRAQARSEIGRMRDAAHDSEKAIEFGRGQAVETARFKELYQSQLNYLGDPRRRLLVLTELAQEFGNKGRRHGVYRQIADTYIQLGDLRQTETYVRLSQARFAESRTFGSFPDSGSGWEANVLQGNARLLEVRGQYREAEGAYRRSRAAQQVNLAKWTLERDGGLPRSRIELQIDLLLAFQGRVKARQGRLSEGESDIRKALLNRLTAVGKYHMYTAQVIGLLANVLAEQGRFDESEKLIRTQIDIYQALGADPDSQSLVSAWNQLATILNLAGRWNDAAHVYNRLDDATKAWEPTRREQMTLNISQIATLYNTNNLSAGIAASQRLLARQKGLFGEQHLDTALARGMLAIGLAKSGQDTEALGEFVLAVPVILAAARESAGEDTISGAAREQRGQVVIEAYMALLARDSGSRHEERAALIFQLAEAIRDRTVQRALFASSARILASNPELAVLARKDQDLEKQVAAQLGVLNNTLALPPEQRDDAGIREIQNAIDKARRERLATRKDIAKHFPTYADLVDPSPSSLDEVRTVLTPDEALVSFYFGREASFVWAISGTGSIAFALIPAGTGDLDTRIKKLRDAVDSNVSFMEDIPAFDIGAAHDLYRLLLEPVEAVWRPAKSLIVVTNGALGLLPLSLLPTKPGAQESNTSAPTFSNYQSVSWLVRTHAVSLVPSSSALRTLRQLPRGSDKRATLIGFGDPFFSLDQAAEAGRQHETLIELAATTGRGLPFKRRAIIHTRQMDSAELARLPRLPDTADELISIARSLQTDPAKVLNLGKNANERRVKDVDLSKFRIVAFATHGLVPGDLNGLTQPALALTAPEVAGVDGDGLLTMEEVLPLKLDADWVVLSACNTGLGIGPEAVSGLGRAFFYAGTRALLVTNWPVHSASARDLVTDIFHRQASDAKLTRAHALQQAMLALIDGPGFTLADKTFSYAHPVFWAPYSIIGDGGLQ